MLVPIGFGENRWLFCLSEKCSEKSLYGFCLYLSSLPLSLWSYPYEPGFKEYLLEPTVYFNAFWIVCFVPFDWGDLL